MKDNGQSLNSLLTIAFVFGVAAAGLAFADDSLDSTNSTLDDLPSVQAATAIDAGRYLAVIGGCNDCHTMQEPARGR